MEKEIIEDDYLLNNCSNCDEEISLFYQGFGLCEKCLTQEEEEYKNEQ